MPTEEEPSGERGRFAKAVEFSLRRRSHLPGAPVLKNYLRLKGAPGLVGGAVLEFISLASSALTGGILAVLAAVRNLIFYDDTR